ncbi:Dynamin family protein [Natronincola peptidivorans]|uniref:Dynamin family protein n=1 Tax=Natronincola peptidivorans TaxID=426128 RepID=A0A1I0G8I0_9FIRM|nr:dynamin family protein [Natronincola peptidivorans]SET67234.1 Dynamin family protein [Natronincola peptidivorans]
MLILLIKANYIKETAFEAENLHRIVCILLPFVKNNIEVIIMLKDLKNHLNLYINCLHQMKDLGKATRNKPIVKKCDDLLERIEGLEFHVAVIGQFKRGKSTLLNYFIGENLLPTGVVPITSIITKVKYGTKPQARIIFEEDIKENVDIHHIDQYISEQKNPKNIKKVAEMELLFPAEILKNGLVLVDTPGIGSTYKHNTEVSYGFLSEADAAIFVISSDAPISEIEIQLLREVKKYMNKLFFIQNKTDYLSKKELEESLSFSIKVIEDAIGIEPIIYPVSAKLAFEGKIENNQEKLRNSGMILFEEALGEFLLNDRGNYLMNSYKTKLISFMDDLAENIHFKLNLLNDSIDALEEKIILFKERLKATSSMKRETMAVVEAELKEIIKIFEGELVSFRQEQSELIKKKLKKAAEDHKEIDSKELDNLLNQQLELEIEQAYETWNKQQETKIRKSYEEITSRFTDKLNETIEEINHVIYDLFKIKVVQSIEDFQLIQKDTFYFKFGDSSHLFFTPKLKDFLFLLPKQMRNKKIISDIVNRVEKEIEKNGNNLKWDYTCKIRDSKYIFESAFEQHIQSITEELVSTIEATVELKQKQDHNVAEEIQLCLERKRMLEQIKNQIVS